MSNDVLNLPIRSDEEWIAKRLRENGLHAEVTNYRSELEDGLVFVGKCEHGDLYVQVGADTVSLVSHGEVAIKYYPGKFPTIQALLLGIQGKLV